jgi:predicted esterase
LEKAEKFEQKISKRCTFPILLSFSFFIGFIVYLGSKYKPKTMKQIVLTLLVSCFLSANCDKNVQDPRVKELSAVRGYKNWFIDTFRCGVFVPPSYDPNKKYPLIIFLHGYSDTTSWNLGWYNNPIVTKDPCIVLTPKCPKEDMYRWGSTYDLQTSPMMAKTYEMMDLVKKAFHTDSNRYYIYGSSMGGYGTYGAIMKNPHLFAAAYTECGSSSIEIAPILAKIPFWMFHGAIDPVVPVQPDRDLYQAVLKLGGTQIRYTEYPGVGHNVWDYTRYETTLSTWLLAQRKGVVHHSPEAMNHFTGVMAADKKVTLQWEIPQETTPPSDDNVWYCRIYRNGDVIKEVYNNQHAFIDSSLVANHTYDYKISVVNYYFKESPLSAPVSFTLKE